jgi:hypothetical protein
VVSDVLFGLMVAVVGWAIYRRFRRATASVNRDWPALPTAVSYFDGQEERGSVDEPRLIPFRKFRIRLGSGNREAFTYLKEALQEARANGELDALEPFYVYLMMGVDGGDRLSKHIRSWLSQADAPSLERILVVALAKCSGPDSIAALEPYDVPTEVLFAAYTDAPRHSHLPVHPEFEQKALDYLGGDWSGHASLVARAVGRLREPEGPRIANRLLDEAATSKQRVEFADWLGPHPNPELDDLYTRECREHANAPEDALCDRLPDDAPRTVLDFVRQSFRGSVVAFARHRPDRGGEMVSMLADHLEEVGAGGPESGHILRALAALDWSAAREVAKSFPDEELVDRVGLVTRQSRVLRRFETRRGLVGWARSHGLVPADFEEPEVVPAARDLPRAELRATTVIDLLRAADRIHSFDTEPSRVPVRHDLLFTEISELADGVLAEVAFRETPPQELEFEEGAYDPKADFGPYTLEADLGFTTLREEASFLHDWYDVTAVTPLLNRACDRLDKDLYFAGTATSQVAHVFVAKPEGLAAAQQEQFL